MKLLNTQPSLKTGTHLTHLIYLLTPIRHSNCHLISIRINLRFQMALKISNLTKISAIKMWTNNISLKIWDHGKNPTINSKTDLWMQILTCKVKIICHMFLKEKTIILGVYLVSIHQFSMSQMTLGITGSMYHKVSINKGLFQIAESAHYKVLKETWIAGTNLIIIEWDNLSLDNKTTWPEQVAPGNRIDKTYQFRTSSWRNKI